MAQLGTTARPLRVTVVGAGPAGLYAAQASFTPPELRELGNLEGVDVVVDPRNIELDPASRAGIEDDRSAKTNLRHSWPRRSR
jgi:2-polyprenyl-6-methoxyphenol hydroxylase-like FAD-dependent oxidoreductase